MRSKQLSEHGKAFAKGGADKMFGQQSAGKAKPAMTGKSQTPAPGAKSAKGGPPLGRSAVSKPAAAAHTAPPTKGR